MDLVLPIIQVLFTNRNTRVQVKTQLNSESERHCEKYFNSTLPPPAFASTAVVDMVFKTQHAIHFEGDLYGITKIEPENSNVHKHPGTIRIFSRVFPNVVIESRDVIVKQWSIFFKDPTIGTEYDEQTAHYSEETFSK